MNTIISSELEIRTTPTQGRGVFATRAYAKGELVDTAPVILGSGPRDHIPQWIEHFLYDWPEIGGSTHDHAVALGYGSLYNSSTTANLTFRAGNDNATILYHAARDIEPGEQLTINYSSDHGESSNADNTWFQDRGIHYHED